MTPQQLIDDAIASFGQFAGKSSQVEQDFWEILHEVELVVKPADCLKTSNFTAVVLTDYLSIDLSATRAFDIGAVFRQSDGIRLSPVSEQALMGMSLIFPSGSVYAYFPEQREIRISRGQLVSPPTVYRVSYFEPTAQVSANTDLPIIDRLYPYLRVGLLARLSLKAKDMDRAKVFEQEYVTLLMGKGNE